MIGWINRFADKLVTNRHMIKCLVVRELKSRYADSLIGSSWAILHPVATVATYTFVFSYVLKAKLGQGAGTGNFLLWLLSGILPWFFFSETIQRSLHILIENKTLITKSVFPAELLLLSNLLANLVKHGIMFIVVMLLILVTDRRLPYMLWYLPVYVVLLSLFTVGLGWCLSAAYVYVRDVGQVLNVVIGLWFFYTPIVYEPSNIPVGLQPLLRINPLYHIAEGYRVSMLGVQIPPEGFYGGLLYLGVLSVVICIVGGIVFKYLKRDFAEML
ncbi:MAG: ABC transporter permease [Nitrospirae bacterium]|uniref:ABC transporter permease n=1 Tax=Candidatus Magnetobacterium casense TaxID=1455061 RepID=UPI00058EA1D3|nr:ABC transporter permease [Candidatus Magnetobacterium casensis]MBF0336714.1 ABC transporter permease [Nitrospirota bacterium]